MKFATFVEAPGGPSGGDVQDWSPGGFVQRLAASAPTMRGCVQRTVRESPGTPIDAISSPDPDFGSFDVLIESWFSSVEDFRREVLPVLDSLETVSARHISYLVTPRLQLDPRISESGPDGRRPRSPSSARSGGRTGSHLLRHPRVRPPRRDRASVPDRHHEVRAEHRRRGPELVTGVTPIDAYADFSFRTVEDCRVGLRATPEERQDTSGFVQAGRFAYLDDARPIERRSTDL